MNAYDSCSIEQNSLNCWRHRNHNSPIFSYPIVFSFGHATFQISQIKWLLIASELNPKFPWTNFAMRCNVEIVTIKRIVRGYRGFIYFLWSNKFTGFSARGWNGDVLMRCGVNIILFLRVNQGKFTLYSFRYRLLFAHYL